jgi:hypothetical protein
MSNEKRLALVDLYRAELTRRGVESKAMNTGCRPASVDTVLAHCLWMLSCMPAFISEGKFDKFDRWLGYIQGCFACCGIFTVDQMRDQARSDS